MNLKPTLDLEAVMIEPREGGCMSCNATDVDIIKITIGGLTVRICEDCKYELDRLLERLD